jgi:hypothetical protein
MVPAVIPFAVAAAFFPAAVAVMLWLLATPPRVRRGVVYLAGAGTTVGSGIVILALLHGGQDAPSRRAGHPWFIRGFTGVDQAEAHHSPRPTSTWKRRSQQLWARP